MPARALLLVFAALCAVCQHANAATEVLGNEDVIAMAKAGLPAEVMVAKINASETAFDTSVATLISLSEAGVDTAVIEAMAGAGTATASVQVGATPAPTARSNFVGTPCATPGIFVEEDGNLHGIDVTSASQTRTGSGILSGITYGIVSTKAKAVIRGPRAMRRVRQGHPTFWFCFEEAEAGLSYQTQGAVNPSEFLLVSFQVKKRSQERTFEIGKFNLWSGSQSGTPPKQLKDVSYEQVQPGVFRVSPVAAIEPGEYGFYYAGQGALTILGAGIVGGGSGGKVFAFGVDG